MECSAATHEHTPRDGLEYVHIFSKFELDIFNLNWKLCLNLSVSLANTLQATVNAYNFRFLRIVFFAFRKR